MNEEKEEANRPFIEEDDWEGHDDFKDDTQNAHITDPLHSEQQQKPKSQALVADVPAEGQDGEYGAIGESATPDEEQQNYFQGEEEPHGRQGLGADQEARMEGEPGFEEGEDGETPLPDLPQEEDREKEVQEEVPHGNQIVQEPQTPLEERLHDFDEADNIFDEQREPLIEEEKETPTPVEEGTPDDGRLSYQHQVEALTVAADPAKDNFSQRKSNNLLTEYKHQGEPDTAEIQWLESQLKGLFEDDVIQPRDTQFDAAPSNYIDLVKATWNEAKKTGSAKLGQLVMKNFFMQSPQTLQLFSFKSSPNLYESEELRKTSSKLLSVLNQVVASLGDEQRTKQITVGLSTLGQKHKDMGVETESYTQMCKAIMIALGITLKDKFTNDVRLSWAIVLRKLAADMTIEEEIEDEQQPNEADKKEQETASEGVVNPSSTMDDKLDGFLSLPSGNAAMSMKTPDMEQDLDEVDEPVIGSLNPTVISEIQESWKIVIEHDGFGTMIMQNLFKLKPKLLGKFSYGHKADWPQSIQFAEHTQKITATLGKVVRNLNTFETIVPELEKLGGYHIPLGIQRADFKVFGQALMISLEAVIPADRFTSSVQQAWKLGFGLVRETMEKQHISKEAQDRLNAIQHLQTMRENSGRPVSGIEDSFRTLLSQSDRGLLNESESEMIQRSKTKPSADPTEVRDYYTKMFQKEVDFHHKVAYRFEKGYRLGKTQPDKIQMMNMEILECIAEHSAYVESDPMSLFYCLFFCIVYQNDNIVEFLRSLIQKLPPIPKLDRLLELVDVYGLKRLWIVGDPINQVVNHLVFYQAVDDNLRVVYKTILMRCRFFQLRDKDALHFLNERDYEMIRRTFEVHVAKVDLKATFQKEQSLKCHSYRKYNQAFFEEISVVKKIEQRVAQHYRERFIITQDDIYTVFEMYCREDYFEQFKRTDKTLITMAQFKELFKICIQNDSFKVASIIYCLYLDSRDFDSKMMTLILETIQDSVKFHEIKMFFLMEHFDELSVYQLNQLLDIYQRILHSPNPGDNPIVSQFNPTKVALMIYRICWMIQEREIYSLVTKCYLLQSFLSKSIISYLERQKNLLVLYKRLTEPILSLTQTKDCFDLMSEMSLIDLLQHPVVVELLSLAFEGNYSASGSALNLSPTFEAMLDAPVVSDKIISRKILGNVTSFGNNQIIQQSSMMYNIWQVSISQRLDDEVLFTGLYGLIIFAYLMAYGIISNESFEVAKKHFGGPLAGHQALFIDMNLEGLALYCEEEADLLLTEYNIVQRLGQFSLFGGAAFFTSIFQRIVTQKVRNNVNTNWLEMTSKVSFVTSQILFLIYRYPSELNELFVHTCSEVIDFSDSDKDQLNSQFSFRYPVDTWLNQELLLSLMTFILGLICFEAFQRSSGIGRMLTMFQEMILQLVRFFATFGIGMALFYMAGRLILQQIKFENNYLLSNLFDGLNGRAQLEQFTKPVGQVFISSYTFIFRILALSVLSAIFINKYKDAFINLESVKRLQIINLKNSVGYDSQVGGLTIPFFPFCLLAMPFWPAVLLMRNKAINEFALKIVYFIMIIMYGCIIGVLSFPMLPILYVKMIANCFYALIVGAREQEKNQNLYTFVITVILGLPLALVSLLIDFIQFPQLLMRSSKDFENKYRTDADEMNDQQTLTVSKLFFRLFKAESRYLYVGKTFTLGDLMIMHQSKFSLISYLHELFCRGSKDYVEALSNVKDYNLSKTVTSKCAIPDKNGDFVRAECVMDLIRNVQEDLEIYNYVEIILRQYMQGTLVDEALSRSGFEEQEGDEEEDDNESQQNQLQVDELDEDTVRWRNPLEFNMNFNIDVAAISFTSIQDEMIGDIDTQEIKRVKRYEKEIEDRKEIWKGNTVAKFETEMNQCLSFVRQRVTGINEPGKPIDTVVEESEEAER